MKTVWLLAARYEGLAIIPVDAVCADYFGHLAPEKFIRKVDAGEIDIPLVRIEGSSKCQRGVQLNDLAAYLDARVTEARNENDKMHGRKVRQGDDKAA